MAYTSWSVVFGEQPSAAKWNILGTNDAYFDTSITTLNGLIGSVGTDTVLNNIPYQSNTSNSVRDSVLIQHGYGVIVAGAAASFTETVTFPTAYDSIPIVICCAGGDDTAGSTTLGAGGNEDQSFHVRPISVTSTNFVANGRALANWAASTTQFYHWISIGVNT